MNQFKIFLSGGMSDITYYEANRWRIRAKQAFEERNISGLKLFNPNDHYNYLDFKAHNFKSIPEKLEYEYEARQLDLYHIKTSNLVIAYFNSLKSIGTAQELITAYNNGIPVVGVVPQKNRETLHPWLQFCCSKLFVEDNTEIWDDVADYIADCYL